MDLDKLFLKEEKKLWNTIGNVDILTQRELLWKKWDGDRMLFSFHSNKLRTEFLLWDVSDIFNYPLRTVWAFLFIVLSTLEDKEIEILQKRYDDTNITGIIISLLCKTMSKFENKDFFERNTEKILSYIDDDDTCFIEFQ